MEEVSPQQFHEELKHKMAKYEFVVVYKSDGTSLHAVYVEKYKPVQQRVRCINSWGSKDPNPDLTIKDVLKLYRVKCSVVDPHIQQIKKEEAAQIQSAWKENHRPSLTELKSASKLATEGYLTSVQFLNLKKINICDIHSDQISKLSSIVSKKYLIWGLKHSNQLSCILANVRSTELRLFSMSLDQMETRALVTAMRDQVEEVELGQGVSLDTEHLSLYWETGRGKCRLVTLTGSVMSSLGEEIRPLAEAVGWRVSSNISSGNVTIERI